eukprot:c15835_g1_i2 orf=184-1332(+)
MKCELTVLLFFANSPTSLEFPPNCSLLVSPSPSSLHTFHLLIADLAALIGIVHQLSPLVRSTPHNCPFCYLQISFVLEFSGTVESFIVCFAWTFATDGRCSFRIRLMQQKPCLRILFVIFLLLPRGLDGRGAPILHDWHNDDHHTTKLHSSSNLNHILAMPAPSSERITRQGSEKFFGVLNRHVSGRNSGSNSQILSVGSVSIPSARLEVVAETFPIRTKASGQILSVGSRSNPGVNEEILAENSGPNPGGNANILSTISERHPASRMQSVLTSSEQNNGILGVNTGRTAVEHTNSRPGGWKAKQVPSNSGDVKTTSGSKGGNMVSQLNTDTFGRALMDPNLRQARMGTNENNLPSSPEEALLLELPSAPVPPSNPYTEINS